MRSDTVDVFGMSSQGAQVAGHFEHDSLRRISGVWFGEIGRNEERYYFNAQGLFFVQEVALEYDSLLSGRVVRAETTITVLQDTVASAWRMTGGRRSILPHSEAADQARRVRTWADTLRFLLRQRSPYDAP
ncbi:MAG: hypothetical protein NTW87_12510 [Planctomycetota bacterium]|nr:hypothetical protein [Planctomycetota bacterium]